MDKWMDSLTLKRLNYFQSQNDRRVTDTVAPRTLIFKLQQEILKTNLKVFVKISFMISS